jgi:integrase
MPRTRKRRHRASGEGTIFQRKDARWVAQTAPLPHLNGERKAFYGKTSQEAREKRAAYLATLPRQANLSSQNWTLDEWMDYWLENVVRRNRRAITHRNYEVVITNHIVPLLGHLRLRELTLPHIENWLAELHTAHHLSSQSIRNVYAVLRAALNHAVKSDLVIRNVATLADMPRSDTHKARHLTPVESRALLRAVKGDRLEALFVLCLSLGLRRGEVLGLTWDDVDLDKGIVHIQHTRYPVRGADIIENPKTRASQRHQGLPSVTRQSLRTHRARQQQERLRLGAKWRGQNYVFTNIRGAPMSTNMFRYHLDKAVKRAGIESLHIHGLRHTAVSLMIRQKVDIKVISEAIGHTNIATTLDIYGHVYDEQRREMAEAMDAILTDENII